MYIYFFHLSNNATNQGYCLGSLERNNSSGYTHTLGLGPSGG